MERIPPTKSKYPPEVLEAFRKMVELENHSDEWPPPERYWDEWWRLHNIVHRALGCKPWQYPCIQYPDIEGPDQDPAAQERYRQLVAAALPVPTR